MYYNFSFMLAFFFRLHVKVERNYTKKNQKKIKVGFIAKEVGTLIVKALRIREEFEGHIAVPYC